MTTRRDNDLGGIPHPGYRELPHVERSPLPPASLTEFVARGDPWVENGIVVQVVRAIDAHVEAHGIAPTVLRINDGDFAQLIREIARGPDVATRWTLPAVPEADLMDPRYRGHWLGLRIERGEGRWAVE